MLKIAVIAVLLIIGAVLVLAAFGPDSFRVQRATIKAPPEKIFPLINDFQRWGA